MEVSPWLITWPALALFQSLIASGGFEPAGVVPGVKGNRENKEKENGDDPLLQNTRHTTHACTLSLHPGKREALSHINDPFYPGRSTQGVRNRRSWRHVSLDLLAFAHLLITVTVLNY